MNYVNVMLMLILLVSGVTLVLVAMKTNKEGFTGSCPLGDDAIVCFNQTIASLKKRLPPLANVPNAAIYTMMDQWNKCVNAYPDASDAAKLLACENKIYKALTGQDLPPNWK